MDPRRGLQQEYGRSRGGDGGGYGPLPSSSGRAIPPTAVPSLSTGQGFYTVESLQGATMVPPPQPAPPPPRLLPPPEPYPRDLPPPRHSHRLHPAQRGDFTPFDRGYSPRKMMMMPPPEFPLPHRAEGMRGHGMLHRHPPPPFMGDPRMPGFFPGRRDPPMRGGWGPSGDFDRHLPDGRHDRSRPSQRIRPRKQGPKTAKPVSQAKSPSKAAAAEKRSSADKKNSVEVGPGWCAVCKIDCLKADALKKHVAGKRHKKQVESQMEVENPSDKAEESENKGGGMTAAAAENLAAEIIENKNNEVGKSITGKEGELAHKSAESTVIDNAEGEGKNELTEPAATLKSVTSVAGKKRAPKEEAPPKTPPKKKQPRKSAASSDATNSTSVIAVKEAEDASNVSEAVETLNVTCANEAMLDTHTKGTDHVSSLKKSANSLKSEGDGKEAPTSGENLSSIEEIPEGGEDGSKEVRNFTKLANGKAGQSAEIQ